MCKEHSRMRKPKVLDPSEFSLPTQEHQFFFCLEKDFTLCFHFKILSRFWRTQLQSCELNSAPQSLLGTEVPLLGNQPASGPCSRRSPQSTQMFLETRLVIRQPLGRGSGEVACLPRAPKARSWARWSSRAPERGACCHSEAVLFLRVACCKNSLLSCVLMVTCSPLLWRNSVSWLTENVSSLSDSFSWFLLRGP